MKFILIKIIVFCLIILFNTAKANSFDVEYIVSVSSIKIGILNWALKVKEGEYQTKINLKNSGMVSVLYKFKGEYSSSGKIDNDEFKTNEYKQY